MSADDDDVDFELDDDGTAYVLKENAAQLSFAFMSAPEQTRFRSLGKDGADVSTSRAAPNEAQLTKLPDAQEEEHPKTRRVAIFSMLDIVEALRTSGAATTYPGWSGATAFAKAHMSSVNAQASALASPIEEAASNAATAPPSRIDITATAEEIELSPSPDVSSFERDAPESRGSVARALSPRPDRTERLVEAMIRRAREPSRPTITLDMDEASGNEGPRLKRLLGLYEDERGAFRRLLIADEAMIDRLHELDRVAPAFARVTGLVRRAALLSAMTQSGLAVAPILLSGPPGVGKSFYADRLAEAIGTSLTRIAVAVSRDLSFLGFEPIWRTPSLGSFTKALLASDTANPIVFLDELEKAATGYEKAPLDPLLSLLEPQNAKALADNYLGIAFNYSHVIVLATVNEPDALSAPLRDRFQHVRIRRPTRVQMLAVARSMLETRVRAFGGLVEMPDNAVVEGLARHHPRRAARLIELSLGFMAEARRTRLTIEDIFEASELIDVGADRPGRIGFVPMQVAESD